MLNDVSTEFRLEEIRLRRSEATQGGWFVSESREPFQNTTYIVENVERFRGHLNAINLGEDKATADFIAATPEDIDFLLDLVQQQKELIDQLQEKK